MKRLLGIALLILPLAGQAAENATKAIESAAAEPILKSIAKPGETFSLKYAFKQDEAKSFVSDSSMEFKNQIGPMTMPMSMQMKATVSIKTTAVDSNGVSTVEVKMDSIDGEMGFSGQKQKLPSQMMQNRNQSVKISPRGEWLEGGESAMPMMGPTGPGASMVAQSVYILLPDKPIAVGETWKQESEVEVPGAKQKLKQTIASVLKDVVELNGEKVALISIQETRTGKDIEIDPQALAKKGAPMPPQAGKIILSETNQTRDLAIQFSLDRGSVLSVQEKNKLSSTISGFGGQDQTIKTEMAGINQIKEKTGK